VGVFDEIRSFWFPIVILHDDRIELLLGRTELRQMLSGDKVIPMNRLPADGSTDIDNTISLKIEAKRKRRNGAVHLVLPPHASAPARHPRPALIKAVARGRAWFEKFMAGKTGSIKSLARETGLTPHYVSSVFASAFLAPDIVEAILDGRQPETLKFEQLYKRIPLSWAEQRKQFGFAPSASE